MVAGVITRGERGASDLMKRELLDILAHPACKEEPTPTVERETEREIIADAISPIRFWTVLPPPCHREPV